MGIGRKKRTFAVIVVVIFVVTTIFVSSQSRPTANYTPVEPIAPPPPVSINTLISNDMSALEQTKRFDRDIESFMRRWEMTGATFALMRHDSLIYAKGYGYADKEREIKCDASNIFRIASVSKLITATAIMKLVEAGQLSLDSYVFGQDGILCDSIFLNLRTPRLSQVTVDHLLRHTSGITSPFGDPAFANHSVARVLGRPLPLSVDDMVEYATRCRVRYIPGDKYDYSNLGYIILGKVVERISGVEYESYVRDSILHPIGCYDMFIGKNYSEDFAPNEVKYYEVKEATKVEAYDGSGRMTMKSDGGNDVTLLGSAGGWVASSVELLKFVASVDDYDLRENLLTKESIDIMTIKGGMRPIGWASASKYQWLRSGSMAGTSALIKRQNDGYTWVFIVNNSAWIGPKITRYISSKISTSLSRVKEWPERDMFNIAD